MKAMIFAAGLGTRMKPLTHHRPKALIMINNRPLLEIVIAKLIGSGFHDIIINVHHFADQIIEFLESNHFFGVNIKISDETGLLLDTGGGLKKASWFFSDGQPFLLHNVDVISDINLVEFNRYHLQTGAMVTLAVTKRKTDRYLLVNQQKLLCGWKNIKTDEQIIVKPEVSLEEFGFSGIHLLNPEIFPLIIEEDRFSLVNLYLRLAGNHKISVFDHSSSFWADIGTPEKLARIEPLIGKYI